MKRMIQTVFIAIVIALISPAIAANQCESFNGQWQYDSNSSQGTIDIQGQEQKHVTIHIYDKQDQKSRTEHVTGKCQGQGNVLAIEIQDGSEKLNEFLSLQLITDHQAMFAEHFTKGDTKGLGIHVGTIAQKIN